MRQPKRATDAVCAHRLPDAIARHGRTFDDTDAGTRSRSMRLRARLAHDITADRSALQSHVDPARLRNARSPQLNLEGLYGDGPVGHPYLFQRNDPAKLLLGADGQDVLRNGEGTAIIGDPRNDSHVLMSQMHLAFVHAHNQFVDRVRSEGTPESHVFESAARELRWRYQMVVLREFLPTLEWSTTESRPRSAAGNPKPGNPQASEGLLFMPHAKSEAIRLMNEQYEIIWTIANSPDSDLDEPERTDLNEKLEQLLASIKRLKPRPN
jgi:hypothetical protein